MDRRSFVKSSATNLLSLGIAPYMFGRTSKDLIIGHNSHQYKVDTQWGKLDPNQVPVNDCHEMVVDAKGRIIMLTNHTKNNVIIYDSSGKLIETWGTEYPGAHGLSIHDENGEEFLYIADNNRHQVIKTRLNGEVMMTLDYPKETGNYPTKESYVPTETAIAANGDIYVADGYGLQYIIHYDAKGNLKNIFGGKGPGDEHFGNAHGICIDNRNQNEDQLLITDRMANTLKRFQMDGAYVSSIHLPGAYICRPVISNQHIYLATIWSDDGSSNTGFVSILNEKNELISAPGGRVPRYKSGTLQKMYQSLNVFKHPHDVCVDKNEDLYVCQWNAGKSYPIKLIRV